MPQTRSWNNRLHILVVDNHRVVNNFDTHQNPPNPLMTVRHYTLLESFYDIFEFTSKIKQQEKQEKLKNLKKKGNRVTITEKRVTIWSSQESCIRHWWKCVTMAKTWHDYRNPNLGGLLHKAETCHDLLKSCHDFRRSCCLFKLKTILKTRVMNWREQSAILRPKDG